MGRAFIFRMLLGSWWYGIELAPITIVVVLLRLRSEYAIVAVIVLFVVMNVAQFAFEPFNAALFLSMVSNTPICLALQVPVWGLTAIAVKLAHRGRGHDAVE